MNNPGKEINKANLSRLLYARAFAFAAIFLMIISSCKKNPAEPEDDTSMFNIETVELETASGASLQFKSLMTLDGGTNSDVAGSTIMEEL